LHLIRKICCLQIVFIFSFFQNGKAQELNVIPYPKLVEFHASHFLWDNTVYLASNAFPAESRYFLAALQNVAPISSIQPHELDENAKSIYFEMTGQDTGNLIQKGSYELIITKQSIVVRATHGEGIFHGIQTLLQVLETSQKGNTIELPCLKIQDSPTFSWRGMHLDVSRHFFSPEFIKKYIDYLSYYKMNVFHWHLTDDQGWRIQLDQFPELTTKGAVRNGSMIGHYNEGKVDTLRYGGFYTKNDIREIVRYAAERHITVVPEIEMPGHALAALSAYPALSCTGGPFEVGKIWGVYDDVFCTKEETFLFLEKVLDEVLELFPSTYIHIGGDECPKVRWENCTHCKQRMKDENLKDAHALQSYFIQRIEKYVNSKGRKIIGWDEILEGGLAENAAVMSWRGTEGGLEAAHQNHDVVMTPGSHCYFDHYQGNPAFEPIAIGGYTPLEKVYSYHVIPSQLPPEKHAFILGAQGNLWTEYVYTEKHAEYMLFPRVLALAEVVWGTANPAQFEAFQRRVTRHFPFFEKNNMHYSKAIFEIQSRVSQSENKGMYVHLTSGHPTGKIRYTSDGTTPNAGSPIYSDSLKITQTFTLTTAVFDSTLLVSNLYAQTFHFSKATGQRISLKHKAHENYAGNGAKTLVDAQKGIPQKYGQNWLGFSGKDVEALIQFDRITDIQELRFQTIESPGSWIYYPQSVNISISKDGKKFKTLSKTDLKSIQTQQGNIRIRFRKTKCIFVKIELKNAGIIPSGFPGAGNPAWLFVDELELN
jgi:hexosaminidase